MMATNTVMQRTLGEKLAMERHCVTLLMLIGRAPVIRLDHSLSHDIAANRDYHHKFLRATEQLRIAGTMECPTWMEFTDWQVKQSRARSQK